MIDEQWKEDYKKSMLWNRHTNMVNADDGTKKCYLCDRVKFTSEFPNADEFDDHKLPVCLRCYRAANGMGKKAVSTFAGAIRTCKKCEEKFTLNHFAYRKNGNKLHGTCRNCVGTYQHNQ